MKQRLGPLYVLAAGTFWGSMGVFVRHFNAAGLGTMEIAWFRNLFGLLTVGGYLLLFHRELLVFRLKDLWCFAGTGLGSLFLLNVTYYTAMQYTSLAVAGVLLYTAPIFVMLLSALLFRETVTRRRYTLRIFASQPDLLFLESWNLWSILFQAHTEPPIHQISKQAYNCFLP